MTFFSMVFNILLCFSFLGFIIYLLVLKRYKYWKNKGVPGPEPEFPVGNIKDMVYNKMHGGHQFQKLYEENKHLPYVGVFMFYRPTLMVNDLDLAKTFLVKDFVHFMDHTLPYNEKYEPLGGHLFNSKGARWKGLRSKLTPAFTSNKMKYMFDSMVESGSDLHTFLDSDSSMSNEIDVKDLIAKFTTDIIVSCALGIEGKSLTNPDERFRKMGQKLLSFDIRKGIVMFINVFAPFLMNYLPLAFIDKDVSDFFIEAIYAVIKHREDNNIKRNDLMQLLIRLKNNESIEENEEATMSKNESNDVQLDKLEIAAEAFGFFVAGFETSSTAASCMLYELSRNPDIQQKIKDEIDEVLLRHNGKITYDSLTEMNYMTQVIEESLRMYPPIPHVFRLCTKEYTIPNTKIVLEKGSRVVVSILGTHYNPDIYPDPKTFDPERFTPENKASRHNLSFLPFGEGPRICIGMRFAMMQIRIAITSIVQRYEVLSTKSSEEGLKFDRRSIFMSPEGLRLRFKKRI